MDVEVFGIIALVLGSILLILFGISLLSDNKHAPERSFCVQQGGTYFYDYRSYCVIQASNGIFRMQIVPFNGGFALVDSGSEQVVCHSTGKSVYCEVN